MRAFAFIQLGLTALLIGGGLYASYTVSRHTEEATITVRSKERLLRVSSNSDGGSTSSYQNFVYTDDEAYTVQDNLWVGHFNARTVWAKIHEGATCKVTLSGYRIGWLSMSQNIIAADCGQPGA